jgi:hypothetical protein
MEDPSWDIHIELPYGRTIISMFLVFKCSVLCPYLLKRNLATLCWFAVWCDHGGPPLGHPHGAAVWDDGGRRDAQSERPGAAGRRVDLSVGYGEGHGAGAGVVRNRFRFGFLSTPLTSFTYSPKEVCLELGKEVLRNRFRSGFLFTFLICSSLGRFVCTNGKLKQPFF